MPETANRRGGKRPGAGRPKGSRSRETLASAGDGGALAELARDAAADAVAALRAVMTDASAPPTARVAAATALLDRGFGKPPTPPRLTPDDYGIGPGLDGPRLVNPGSPDFRPPPGMK